MSIVYRPLGTFAFQSHCEVFQLSECMRWGRLLGRGWSGCALERQESIAFVYSPSAGLIAFVHQGGFQGRNTELIVDSELASVSVFSQQSREAGMRLFNTTMIGCFMPLTLTLATTL